MNRTKIKRLMNEYLDGEIGLADKSELERIMAQDPDVRSEYKELRRLGMLLSGMPEISVHPMAFRARVNEAIDNRQRSFLTPQRAFAASMLVAMLVIGLTFGLNVYQAGLFGAESPQVLIGAGTEAASAAQNMSYSLAVSSSPERYFERLLLEVQLGYMDAGVLAVVSQQTAVYDGASCVQGDDLGHMVQWQRPLEREITLRVNAATAARLGQLAEELGGSRASLQSASAAYSLSEFGSSVAAEQPVLLSLRFQ